MFKKLLHGKRKSALLNLTWSGLLCRVVWSVSQLLYLLQRAGHFKFFSPSFFVGLELIPQLSAEEGFHSHLRRNLSRCFPVCQPKLYRKLRGLPTFSRTRHPEPMRGDLVSSHWLAMTPEEVGSELASLDADGTATVPCCGVGNDAASDTNLNCHFAH